MQTDTATLKDRIQQMRRDHPEAHARAEAWGRLSKRPWSVQRDTNVVADDFTGEEVDVLRGIHVRKEVLGIVAEGLTVEDAALIVRAENALDEAVGLAMLVLDLGKGGDVFAIQDCARGFLQKHGDPPAR